MDLAILTALLRGQLAQIAGKRLSEIETRNAISGDGLEALLNELFPDVDPKLLAANKKVPNHLQQGVSRYVRALVRGETNWEWDGEGDPPDGSPAAWLEPQGRDLTQSLVTDALVTGKFALFPFRDAAGKLKVTALSGFLWPIFAAGDSNDVVGLLQVTSSVVDAKTIYQVRRYSPGMLEVFSSLEDWQDYATSVPQSIPQPHAKDRLPVVFRIASRDANRNPEGLAQTAMPAFQNYLKAAVLVKFISHRGGFEERVVKSDALFQLAKDNPRHELVTGLKKVGPNSVRLLDGGGDYVRLNPVALQDYRLAEQDARADVQNAMNMPDTDGANLSGDALAEKREAYSEAVNGMAALVRDGYTEVHGLLAELDSKKARLGWRVTLKPHFSRDVSAERLALREDFKAGVLPKSAALSGLQSLGVGYVTEEMVQQALDQEAADLIPSVPSLSPATETP